MYINIYTHTHTHTDTRGFENLLRIPQNCIAELFCFCKTSLFLIKLEKSERVLTVPF